MRTLLRFKYSTAFQPIKWRQRAGNLQFLIHDRQTQGTIIYLINDTLTFPELKQRQLFKHYNFTIPKDFQQNTPIHDILLKHNTPAQIEVQFNSSKFSIQNRVAEPDQKAILKSFSTLNSIYQQSKQSTNLNQYRRLATGFYLRLQAEAYLKQKNLDHKAKLTNDIKDQLLSFLGALNQIPEQSDILRFNDQKEKIQNKANITQQKINLLLKQADRLLGLYKLAVIALSTIHLGGFGYMIFGVEWLGWDIVEPLTFSVGTLYTLLGLRFYRRFQKDRTQETVKQALRSWVLRPSMRMELTQLRAKLLQQQGQLRDIQQKIKIAQNRLVTLSTLPNDI